MVLKRWHQQLGAERTQDLSLIYSYYSDLLPCSHYLTTTRGQQLSFLSSPEESREWVSCFESHMRLAGNWHAVVRFQFLCCVCVVRMQWCQLCGIWFIRIFFQAHFCIMSGERVLKVFSGACEKTCSSYRSDLLHRHHKLFSCCDKISEVYLQAKAAQLLGDMLFTQSHTIYFLCTFFPFTWTSAKPLSAPIAPSTADLINHKTNMCGFFTDHFTDQDGNCNCKSWS